MPFNVFTYVRFLLKSTNQHGVHSPFVFNYVTKCLYKKQKKSKDKTLDVLLKSITYFNCKSVKILGNSRYENEVKKQFPDLSFNKDKVDFLFFEDINQTNTKAIDTEYKLHNNSILLVNNINTSKKTSSHWLRLTKWEKASVSIDLFYCGFISIRKEQQKEHFFIRI